MTQEARLGVYLSRPEFDEARSAYLADWLLGGPADTFQAWVAAAIDTHAARTPQRRLLLAANRAKPSGPGTTRSWTIPRPTFENMRAAIVADQLIGRWSSDSAWCAEAIAIAVADIRRAAGGSLPPPPPRLPNRLVR